MASRRRPSALGTPLLGAHSSTTQVYACAFCTLQETEELAKMCAPPAPAHRAAGWLTQTHRPRRRGFADSKKLTEARREELFTSLIQENKMSWATDSLTAAFISEHMLRA